jgi:Fe-S cluster assembly scaffold protein SufB
VWFGDLDRAIAERPDLVEPYLHALVPADRSKFTALHVAFRRPARSCTCPVSSRTAGQAMTDRRRGRGDLPRTLLVAGENAEVTLIGHSPASDGP